MNAMYYVGMAFLTNTVLYLKATEQTEAAAASNFLLLGRAWQHFFVFTTTATTTTKAGAGADLGYAVKHMYRIV